MKVLLEVRNSPVQRFLIDLAEQNFINEVKRLIGKGKYSRAMTTVFSKGKFLREVEEAELPWLDADLILTEKSAHYDLT